MATLHSAPTRELDSTLLSAVHALLVSAFDGDFDADDWSSTLGGVHVWSTVGGEVVSHAALIERTLVCSGDTLNVGYVEAVATRADRRRQGYATQVMQQIAALIRERYALGGLSTGSHAFYARLGWERWLGPTFVRRAGDRQRTPDDDGSIMILRTPSSPTLDVAGDIVCEWRAGEVW